MTANKVESPWQTVSSRTVYDNQWISVREDSVIRPDGGPGIYGVVHFKGLCLGILAIDGDDIYLVGQFRYVLGTYSWEIPEGGAHPGEEPLAAAQRELLEETGFTAKNWKLLGQAHLSNSVSDELAWWYVATGLQAGNPNPEGTEDLTIKKLPFAEALRMVQSGEITDSVSVMAIQSYALSLR